MLTYPHIDPVAFSIGPLHVHWYGLMYLFGFALALELARYRVRRYNLPFSGEAISDLIFYAAIGVIVGGRVGYMLFYHFSAFLQQPWVLFELWKGGMSFHGGLMGVIVALYVFAKRYQKSFLSVTDFTAPLVPLGLAFGRIGNFINGELWGRPTTSALGMVFPDADSQARHPSQLYEFALEGIILFAIIWWYARIPRPTGRVSAIFLIGYALCRLIVELFREPDAHLGFIAFNWVTMGQFLSLPMILFGILLWIKR